MLKATETKDTTTQVVSWRRWRVPQQVNLEPPVSRLESLQFMLLRVVNTTPFHLISIISSILSLCALRWYDSYVQTVEVTEFLEHTALNESKQWKLYISINFIIITLTVFDLSILFLPVNIRSPRSALTKSPYSRPIPAPPTPNRQIPKSSNHRTTPSRRTENLLVHWRRRRCPQHVDSSCSEDGYSPNQKHEFEIFRRGPEGRAWRRWAAAWSEVVLNVCVVVMGVIQMGLPVAAVKLVAHASNLSRLTQGARYMVGLNKRFFVEGQWSLDLTFITDRVIGMGLPASNCEALYRNPIQDVSHFFRSRFPDDHLIIDLCVERSYPHYYFYKTMKFPFDDHSVPALETLLSCCEAMGEFLHSHPQGVVAVHCKGGKGRTGVALSSWLLYSGITLVRVGE
eukprot:GHVN01060193.1.p1 GENE.GHVN01060193.1~~GHVN01060193.1.p1  ORF type:complete len:398 (+),score=54.82 GHVN01060193.1:2969-4162(+)